MLKIFLNVAVGDFSHPSDSGGIFVYSIPASWESYMTPRPPIGVRWKNEGSCRESPLLPPGRLGVIYDSQPHGYALFLSHPDWGGGGLE